MSVFLSIVGLVFDSSLENLNKSSTHNEADNLISLLQHARAKATSNICRDSSCVGGSAHGLSIQYDSFVVFEGSTYNSANRTLDQITPRNINYISTGINEIVFANLSGDAVVSGDIILTATTGEKLTISIGQEGQIIWKK